MSDPAPEHGRRERDSIWRTEMDGRRARLTAVLLRGCRDARRRFRGWTRGQHPSVRSIVLGETDDRLVLRPGAGPPSVAVAAPEWARPRTEDELAMRPGRPRREEEGNGG